MKFVASFGDELLQNICLAIIEIIYQFREICRLARSLMRETRHLPSKADKSGYFDMQHVSKTSRGYFDMQ